MKKHLIIFDMDGVIVDVSDSYRDVVRQTARWFLKQAKNGNRLPDPLFSRQDLAALKQSGGLNNDWELTYTAMALLMSKVTRDKIPSEGGTGDPWQCFQQSIRQADARCLIDYLKTTRNPLQQLWHRQQPAGDAFIARLSAGDVGSGNLIKQVFQEMYLGTDLFKRTYGVFPHAHLDSGHIDRERLFIDPADIKSLAKRHILAIATGRPRAEADYPLDHHGLRSAFSAVYTLDDCLQQAEAIRRQTGKSVDLSKPDPFMLDAIADRFHDQVSACYYLGDMPDDMMAAVRSKHAFIGIGCLYAAADRQALARSLTSKGARHLAATPAALLAIIDA